MIAWHGGRPRQCHPGGWLCQAHESVSSPAGRREGRTIMNYRRITGLFGAAGALAVGTEIAQAQDLGESIASSVSGAVSDIATNNEGSVIGGVSVEHSQVNMG